jgi:hypothetical protein
MFPAVHHLGNEHGERDEMNLKQKGRVSPGTGEQDRDAVHSIF